MLDVLGIEILFPILDEDTKSTYKKYLTLKAEKRFEESDLLRKELMDKGVL
jgi:hypothetical protein